ncbi:MAG: fibrobacter succinogenes major paralogous domain-containing protein, partial [Prevotellaceae bacterium]|nr:fibrobacter succinogenes major paralogous domain-containing protein [Prevotellaceae bacterium]
LKAVNVIPASFPNASAITDDAHKQALAGAMVWNTNDEFPINGDGIYLWDGSKWNYIGGSDGGSIPTGDGTFTGKPCFDIAIGNDGINGCSTIGARQKTVFTDRTSQDGVSVAPYSGVQVYTFTPSSAVSNVRFDFIEAAGAGKIVESIVPSADYSGTVISSAKVTVNYKSSLQNDLSGLTRDTGLKLKLYVIYNDGDIDRSIELNISLQDCACCGAYVASGVWKAFMCQNLGANEAADPFTPAAEIHGAKYKWGVNRPALTQAQDQNSAYDSSVPNWDTITVSPTTSGINWLSTANPCPPGWRVPTDVEWQGVIDYNNEYRTDDGGANWTAANVAQSWSASNTDFTNGIKFGDALVLPAAGYRYLSNGSLDHRGYFGYYWSSTATGSYGRNLNCHGSAQYVYPDTNRSYGLSVRCVEE